MSNRIDITQKAIQEAISGNTYIGRLVSADDLRGLPGNKIDVLIDGEVSMRAAVEVPVLPNPEDAIEGVFYITPDGVIHYLVDGEWKTIVADGAKIYRVHELPTTDIDPQGIYIIDATEEEGGGADIYTLAVTTYTDFSQDIQVVMSYADWSDNHTTVFVYKNGSLVETIRTYNDLRTALTTYDISGTIPVYLQTNGRLYLQYLGYKITSTGTITGGGTTTPTFRKATATVPAVSGSVPGPAASDSGKVITSEGTWEDVRKVIVIFTKMNFFDVSGQLRYFLKDSNDLFIDSIIKFVNGNEVAVSKADFFNGLYTDDTPIPAEFANCAVYFVPDTYKSDINKRHAYGMFETSNIRLNNGIRNYPVIGLNKNLIGLRDDYSIIFTHGKLRMSDFTGEGYYASLSNTNVRGYITHYEHPYDSTEVVHNYDFGQPNNFSAYLLDIRGKNIQTSQVYFVDMDHPLWRAYAVATLADENQLLDDQDYTKLYLRNLTFTAVYDDYDLVDINSANMADVFAITSGAPKPGWQYLFKQSDSQGVLRYDGFNTSGGTETLTSFAEWAADTETPCMFRLYADLDTADQAYVGTFVKKRYYNFQGQAYTEICCVEVARGSRNSFTNWTFTLSDTGYNRHGTTLTNPTRTATFISEDIAGIYGMDGSTVRSMSIAEFCGLANLSDPVALWYQSGSNWQYLGTAYISVDNPTINAVVLRAFSL